MNNSKTWWIKDKAYYHRTYYNTSRWRKLRLQVLAEQPLCVMCLSADTVTTATIIDHIIPIERDESLGWSKDNLQALCCRCSGIKTARDQQDKVLFNRR